MSDAVRSGQSRTVDARAVETRRRLGAAFQCAIVDQIHDITVVRLCKIAGVGRSTFYTHFATIEDLAVAVISDLFTDVSPMDVERRTSHELSRAEITRLGLEQLLESLWASRGLLAYVVALPAGPAVQQRIVSDVAQSVRPTVLAEQPDLTESALRLASNFIAGGFIQLVLTWLEEPEVTRADAIKSLLSLLPTWMTGQSAVEQVTLAQLRRADTDGPP